LRDVYLDLFISPSLGGGIGNDLLAKAHWPHLRRLTFSIRQIGPGTETPKVAGFLLRHPNLEALAVSSYSGPPPLRHGMLPNLRLLYLSLSSGHPFLERDHLGQYVGFHEAETDCWYPSVSQRDDFFHHHYSNTLSL